MDLPQLAVFVVKYDPENSYSRSALAIVEERIKGVPGTVALALNAFIVDVRLATPVLLGLYAYERDRRAEHRRLDFSLVPCGNQLFSGLPEGAAPESGALGLRVWDISIPTPPPPH